ncbi:MAG: hypothetical protein AAGI37_18205 [Planctomycetota bacterium]
MPEYNDEYVKRELRSRGMDEYGQPLPGKEALRGDDAQPQGEAESLERDQPAGLEGAPDLAALGEESARRRARYEERQRDRTLEAADANRRDEAEDVDGEAVAPRARVIGEDEYMAMLVQQQQGSEILPGAGGGEDAFQQQLLAKLDEITRLLEGLGTIA